MKQMFRCHTVSFDQVPDLAEVVSCYNDFTLPFT